MWEYRATDPSGNELRHWKYLRKYRNSNGNWTYVYDEKKKHNDLDGLQRAVDYNEEKVKKYEDDIRKYNDAAEEAKRARDTSKGGKYSADWYSHEKDRKEAAKALDDSIRKRDSAQAEARKAQEKLDSLLGYEKPKANTSVSSLNNSKWSNEAKEAISDLVGALLLTGEKPEKKVVEGELKRGGRK